MFSGTLLSAETDPRSRPTIVFLFSDDHATQALGVYGHEISEFAPRPHLDDLAESGMRYDRCLVTDFMIGGRGK